MARSKPKKGEKSVADLEREEEMLKGVAYYDNLVSAWVSCRLEINKQLLTLSALAIGLLVALRDEVDCRCNFVLWLVAGISFTVTILISLWVFYKNSTLVEAVIKESDSEKKKKFEESLQFFFTFASALFIVGVVFTVILAISLTEYLS